MMMPFQLCNFSEKKFKAPSYKGFQRMRRAISRDNEDGSTSSARAEYEAEMKKRYETKMNWGIKDRWE